MTTDPGAASAWRRAARFGVSPTHRLLARGPLADQVADHGDAGGDARPRLKPHFKMKVEPTHLLDQLQRRAHRPLGIVLVRDRPAEVGEHAIAQVLGDMAFEAADHLRARCLISAHDFTQVLGVEPRRQRGRADQIAEQHRQLAAFRATR